MQTFVSICLFATAAAFLGEDGYATLAKREEADFEATETSQK